MSIVSRLTRLSGWTPVGKSVEIEIDECSLPSLLGKILSARVVALKENGAAVLDLIEPIEQGAKRIQAVVAQPRHEGYDFFHVGFGTIAVDLSPLAEEQGIEKQDTRFAIGLIKYRKS